MSEIADAIGGTVADMFGGASEAETEDTGQVAAQEAEVATPEAEAPAEQAWDFEAAGRDLFAEDPDEVPDFDALAEAELGATEQGEDVLAPNDFDDDTTRDLKKQLIAERKRSEYHERQHLTTARKAWEADVKGQPWSEFLPKDLTSIKATSHREFLRQAKTVARSNYEVLKPQFEKIAAERAALKAQVTAEARQEAQTAWGKPSVGGQALGVPATPVQGEQAKIDDAIRRRDMFGATKAMIDAGII